MFITSKATDFGKSLVLKKKVLPKSIVKIMENFTPQGKSIDQLKSNFISHLQQNGGEKEIKSATYAIDGMGVISGIIGAITATNIVTPLLRNKLASTLYKKRNISVPQIEQQKTLPIKPQPQLFNQAPFKNFYTQPTLKI